MAKVTQTADAPEEAMLTGFEIDLSHLPACELLPEGAYPATCVAAGVRLSKAGTPMAEVRLRIDPEDYPHTYDRDQAPTGVLVTHYVNGVSFGLEMEKLKNAKTGIQGVDRLRKLFAAFQVPFGRLTVDARADLNGYICVTNSVMERLIDGRCALTIGHDEYNGEPQLRSVKLDPIA